jgi:hypothetical protein
MHIQQRGTEEREQTETDEHGIEDQSTRTLFVVVGQVNLHRPHLLPINGDGAFFRIEA